MGQPGEAITRALSVQRKSSEHGWVYLVSVKIMFRICLKIRLQATEIQGESTNAPEQNPCQATNRGGVVENGKNGLKALCHRHRTFSNPWKIGGKSWKASWRPPTG
jgi:hypothetical protein